LNEQARRAAFELSFANRRAPLDDSSEDEELMRKVLERAPTATREEAADALTRVIHLSADAYSVCDAYRDGKYGQGTPGRKAAVAELSLMDPGFDLPEYEAAFATGLLWTAF